MEKESPLLRAPKKKASQTLLLLPVNSWSRRGLGSGTQRGRESHWHGENGCLACLLVLRPWPLSFFPSMHIKYFRVIFPCVTHPITYYKKKLKIKSLQTQTQIHVYPAHILHL